MDSSGHLRHIMLEELMTGEDLDHPVDCVADLPPHKLELFRLVDRGYNRKNRKARAKDLKVDWSEYMIYRSLPK